LHSGSRYLKRILIDFQVLMRCIISDTIEQGKLTRKCSDPITIFSGDPITPDNIMHSLSDAATFPDLIEESDHVSVWYALIVCTHNCTIAHICCLQPFVDTCLSKRVEEKRDEATGRSRSILPDMQIYQRLSFPGKTPICYC
jgi:hypothetical protein